MSTTSPAVSPAAKPPPAAHPQRLALRRNCVSLLESFAQTLGALSPVGTIGVIIPLIIATSGNGTWLLLLGALGVFVVVLASVLGFASRHASAGSLGAFAGLGLGPWGGVLGGWVYVVGMFYCIPSAMLASASYCDLLLVPRFGDPGGPARAEGIAVLLTAGMWLAAHRSIRLSTNLMLVIELTAFVLVMYLLASAMWLSGAWVDPAQTELRGVHLSGIQGGVVLAFMLVAGFEGATSLGEEASSSRTSIPRAIASCMLPLAVLYLVIAYCLVSLQNHGIIAKQENGLMAPFNSLAQVVGNPALGPVSSLGIALSYFACGLASLTIASRVLFALARDGHWWPDFGDAHPVNGTPHRAIALISMTCIGLYLVMLLAKLDFDVSFNFVTQTASIGIIVAYLMVVVALPLYLRRRGDLTARDLLIALVAAALLCLVLALSVYPAPPPPFGYVTYAFLGSVAACLSVSAIRAGGRALGAWRRGSRG